MCAMDDRCRTALARGTILVLLLLSAALMGHLMLDAAGLQHLPPGGNASGAVLADALLLHLGFLLPGLIGLAVAGSVTLALGQARLRAAAALLPPPLRPPSIGI